MSDAQDPIVSELHHEKAETIVCMHLIRTRDDEIPRGYFDKLGSHPTAWCTACNEALLAAGSEWTDELRHKAAIAPICETCHERIRSMNTRTQLGITAQIAIGGGFGLLLPILLCVPMWTLMVSPMGASSKLLLFFLPFVLGALLTGKTLGKAAAVAFIAPFLVLIYVLLAVLGRTNWGAGAGMH